MACCRKSSGMSPDIQRQLEAKLHATGAVFPGACFASIVTPQGEIICQINSTARPVEELLAVISSLKRASLHFSTTLDQPECPIIHIKGEHTLFSCYDVDANENVLVLFSEMPALDVEQLDLPKTDAAIQPLLEEIGLLIRNLMSAR